MSFIPEIKMDFVPSDEESENEEIGDMNEDNLPTDINSTEDIKMIVEEVKEAIPITQNVEEIFNMQPAISNPEKLTKKGKPRKKRPPMTDEQKDKLKFAREKAMAVRKAKAQDRQKDKDLDKQEKDLLKKQKIKKVQKLQEEVGESGGANFIYEDEPPPQVKQIVKPVTNTITKKDLEDAQLEAIIKYETIRKARKKEKQARQIIEAEEKLVRDTLIRQITPQKAYNPFDTCY
tara:strand:- start:36 stop:734 length:699 start_codon:yes stop_codon:yes gene_type:complete